MTMKIKSKKSKGLDIVTDFSAFEVTQIAIALCQLHKKYPESLPPRAYFRDAVSLLLEAQTFLDGIPVGFERFKSHFIFGPQSFENYRDSGGLIPFSQLLKRCLPSQMPMPLGRKKARTFVGPITTTTGLEKAIRRYFERSEAAKMIRANGLTYKQFQQLLHFQKTAISERASKRVKGANDKNSQPV